MKAGGIAVALTVLAIGLAYQFPVTLELDLGRSFPSSLSVENFHDAEGGFRWSRARSHLVFRDPGASANARLELQLSGFRPPNHAEPLVIVNLIGSSGQSLRLRPSRRVEEHVIETRTRGLWSSDLEIELRSETFSPGAGDERALGVRVHRARLVLGAGSVPPIRQLLLSALVIALIWVLTGSASTVAAMGVGLAVGFAALRVHVTILVPLLACLLTVITLVRWLVPSVERLVREVLATAARRAVTSVRDLACRSVAIAVVAGFIGVFASYWLTPHLTLDLGSGHATSLARRFGALDRQGDITFRRALAGASLDLRDFGAGSPWTIGLRAKVSGNAVRGTLIEAGGASLTAAVGGDWEVFSLDVPAPSWGWRAGRIVTFPGLSTRTTLSIDRLHIDRGRSIPPVRALLAVTGALLSMIAAFRCTGISMTTSILGATLFFAAALVGLAVEPVLVTPFLPTLLLASASAFLLAAVSAAFLNVIARRGLVPDIPPLATAIALAGFVISFVVTASPLYVGGHYGFHTAIAEEIWQGQFLRYYLPYPGSMLSRQPQWDDVIVPHSCLYHTAVSPFAALPRFWFAALTKLNLSSMVFAIAVVSALVATRARQGHAGAYAALAAAFLPTAFHLLGLGHLMTLFGSWAAALALGFIAIQVERLSERSILGSALALLTLCFLSYTGSLLFASLSLIAACALLYRGYPDLVRQLAKVLGLAWALSFLLYYVHWTVPFVSESLPALLSDSGADTGAEFGRRLAAQPRKLAYTFGSALVPVVGLLGLIHAETFERRRLLYGWASILVGFSLLDLGFNFLLKHHYFTYPVVAIGVGLGLGWAHEKGRLGRWAASLVAVSIAWMGLREALAVATGGV